MRVFMKYMLVLMCVVFLGGAAAEADESARFEPIPWNREKLDEPAPYEPHKECYLPENSGYHDESLDISIDEFRAYDTTIMRIHVKLTDPTQFRTGLAFSSFPSKNVRPVDRMSKMYNAVCAVNGDYFNYHNDGIVIRNGKQLRYAPREGRDTLIVDSNGDFTIITPTTDEAFKAFEGEVIHAFCFGPGLVIDGEAIDSLEASRVDNGKNKLTQRIAIGQVGTLEYVILAAEGPEQKGSKGLDLLMMAQLMQAEGCRQAYNLDGGSSTTVVLDHKKINGLSSGKNRPVADMIYFATLVP